MNPPVRLSEYRYGPLAVFHGVGRNSGGRNNGCLPSEFRPFSRELAYLEVFQQYENIHLCNLAKSILQETEIRR